MTLTFVTSKGRRFKEIFGILNLDGFKFSAFLNVFLIQFNTIRSWMVSFNNKLKDPSLIRPFTPLPEHKLWNNIFSVIRLGSI